MITRKSWSYKVGRVFNTKPRDGSKETNVWLPRLKNEQRLSELLAIEGINIIIDGPTGTGKSSLAITALNKEKIDFCLVQITKNMTWQTFCRELAVCGENDKCSISTELLLGIDKVSLKDRLNFGKESNGIDKLELLKSTADSWNEHDICNFLRNNNIALMIDDFERANEDIIIRISDVCKLLTQSYASPNAKLVIVGTDDIFSRLYRANESLDGRIKELSIGTLPTPEDSWKFMQLGFEALGLKHPANDRYVSSDENNKCMKLIYTAADGLFKSLSEIGYEIAKEGYNRNRISPKDIEKATIDLPSVNFRRFRRSFKEVTKAIENNPSIRTVLEFLFEKGIGQIHYWEDITYKAKKIIPEEHCDNAIGQLIKIKFLIQTGESGDILFVDKPTLAHTTGVILSNPDKFPEASELLTKNCQMQIPFYDKRIFVKD
ncbi:MAG TPA: hypothetical protein DDX14_03445 [Cyanobacteria bacterium UBA9579]|nr:hypothetical protein [Cyanobacteria bacterium UBA9579]